MDAAAKQVARRAPLALAGPLGDLLALGLITWDIYLMLLELQNNANPVPPMAAPPGGTSDPANYDWTGWNVATLGGHPANFAGFGVTSFGTVTWTPVGSPYVVDTASFWNNTLDGEAPGYQVGIGTTLETWLATHVAAGEAFQYKNDYDAVDTAHFLEGPRNAFYGWYQRDWGGTSPEPLYIGVGVPLPMDLPLDWAEPDPNMKRDFFPDGHNITAQGERAPQEDPKYKRGPRYRPRVRHALTGVLVNAKSRDLCRRSSKSWT